MRLVGRALLLSLTTLAAPAAAQVRSTIIGPGVKRLPVAIAPLTPAATTAGGQFERVLGRDLELSGLFRVIPSDTYIDTQSANGGGADGTDFDLSLIHI